MLTSEQQSQRLSLALKGAKCGLWDWNIAEDVIYFDPNYFLIAGYEPDEYPHHFDEWKKRVHPDDLALAERTTQQYLSGEIKAHAVEFRFKTKNGDWMWILGQGEISERDINGNPVRFVGLHIDINDRKVAEQALKESEEKYRLLHDNAPLSYQSLDEDGCFLDINPAWLRTLGYDRQEVIGKCYVDFLHSDWKPHFEKSFPAFKERGYVQDVQFKIRHKDGHYLDISFEGCIGYTPDGKFKQTYCVFQDITKRKQNENKLLESESRYRSLFQNNHSVMLLIDPETATIVDANPAACHYYGYDKETLLRIKITDINQLTEQQVFAEMDSARKAQRHYFNFKHRLANGDIRDIEIYSSPIQVQGKALLLSIIHDITERKQTEKALQNSEAKLDSILRSAPIGIGQVTNREINFANENFAQMLGYSVQELIGNNSRIVYPSDEEFERVGQYKYEEIKKKGTGSIETVLQKKDGTLIDVFLSSTPVNLDDLSQGVTFSALDITERKQAEKTLQTAAHEWRLIMDEFEDVIYLLDNDRHILRANSAFYKVVETTPEQAIGRHIDELVHPQCEKALCPVCLAQEEKRDLVMVMEADDENNPTGKPIEIMVKIVRDDAGASTGILMNLHDLTKKRLAEQKLMESEQKFRLLADYTYDWEYWLNPEGSYIYVSPSCERITGYSADEFMSNPNLMFDLVSPDYAEAVHQHYADENNLETPLYSIEFPIRTKAGEERWLGHHCSPVFDKNGNYLGRRGNNRDITKQHQALQTIIRQKETAQQYLDIAGVMFGALNKQGEITLMNKKGCQILGYPEGELLGRNWFEVCLPVAVQTEIKEVFKQQMSGDFKPLEFYENVIFNSAGEERMISFHNTLLQDETGIYGVLFSGEDTTERKQAEEALIESEQRFRSLMENIPSIAVQGYSLDGTVLFWNRASEQLYGYSAQEALGGNLLDLIIPTEMRGGVIDAIQQMKESGKPIPDGELILKHKSGSQVPVYSSHALLLPATRSPELFCLDIDLTERKQSDTLRLELEEQLAQKHKIEALGMMAGGMAHNFNNNLSIILGGIDLTRIKLPDNSEVMPLLDNAKIAVLRSRDLIQNILSYSRQGVINKEPLKMAQVVDETLKLLRSTIPTTVKIHYQRDAACHDLTIQADATRIQEALINLCNNAIQAMDERGELTISFTSSDLQQKDIPAQYQCTPGAYLQLSVQDSGCGMTEDLVERIFDPFFTTKAVDKGTGMGLATLQGMVVQHGGLIKVKSSPGQGSTFELYFPLSETAQPESSIINTAVPRGSEKIIFLDDNELLAQLGETMLSELGYQITTMYSSTETLKLFQANPDYFDLLITDQTMPDMTGQELIQELRKIRPTLAAILCTGYSSKVDENIAKQFEINAFLMKPLELAKLSQTVRKVLDGVEIE